MSITAPFPVQVITEESKTVRVIINTKNFDPPRTGPVRLPSAKPLHKSVGGLSKSNEDKKGVNNEELQVVGEFLNDGLNVLSQEEVQRLKAQAWFDTLEVSGVITIIDPLPLPDGEMPSGTTADYSPKDAMQIIRSCDDIEWLRVCNNKETARDRSMVKKAIVSRIAELSKKEKTLEEARKA